MGKNRPTLTHQQAIDQYFGGIHGLETQSLPFTCVCGSRTFPKVTNGMEWQRPMMVVPDLFTHIRKSHGETIRKSLSQSE